MLNNFDGQKTLLKHKAENCQIFLQDSVNTHLDTENNDASSSPMVIGSLHYRWWNIRNKDIMVVDQTVLKSTSMNHETNNFKIDKQLDDSLLIKNVKLLYNRENNRSQVKDGQNIRLIFVIVGIIKRKFCPIIEIDSSYFVTALDLRALWNIHSNVKPFPF